MTVAALYNWLMFGHVLAAMVWLGGTAVLGLLAAQTIRHKEPGSLARFAATIGFVGPRLLAPATMLVAGLGVWLVLDSREWQFGQFWIDLAIGLFVAVSVIGAGLQSRAAIGAQLAIADGDTDRAERQVRRWAWGALAILCLLVLITWDMTVKP
jgi:uncharacterized membrane protein